LTGHALFRVKLPQRLVARFRPNINKREGAECAGIEGPQFIFIEIKLKILWKIVPFFL